MNSADREVEEAEILEAEVVDSRQPVRSGKLLGLALLSLTAMAVAVGGAFFSYHSREILSAELEAVKQAVDAVQKESGEIARQIGSAQRAYQAQSQQLTEQKQALAEQQQALAAHRQLLGERDVSLEQERARLEQAGLEMREAIQSVHRRIGADNNRWMAAEAAYLIELANHRLHLEWDVNTAISALETADARLRDSADPNWIPVREMLAQEIISLKGVGLADLEGLALQLSGLAAGVKNLKLLGTERISAARAVPASAKTETGEERNLKTLLRDGWEGFKSIMVIRHHGQPVSALLPPDQQLFIQQNLRLQLEAARVSLLRGNQALFDSSLQSAVQQLNDYFDSGDAKVQSSLAELDELSRFRVRPQLPDISAALIALREQLNKLGQN